MKFDLSSIELSNGDKSAGICLPSHLTPELAELIGIIVGDGHIGIYHNKRRSCYNINISGNIKDEEHMDFARKLMHDIFQVRLHKDIKKEKNSIELRRQSKAICLFFKRNIGIPNNKRNISVPKCILESNVEIKAAFLRGLADADFCLTIKHKPNAYPIVQGGFKSQILTEECSKIFQELGIDNYFRKEAQHYRKRDITYTTHRIYINGYKRVKKYMEVIGFNNRNKKLKYEEALRNRNLATVKHTPKIYR